MPIVDMLVNGMTNNGILSFMDGYSGYNQIFLGEKDIHKTAFHCLSAINIFEWVVMLFGLKNVVTTHQRAMNVIFHDLIGQYMEVYKSQPTSMSTWLI